MSIILLLLLLLLLLLILFISQKKKKELISFLYTYKFTIFSLLFSIGFITLLAIKKITFSDVLADQKTQQKVKRERLAQIRNYIVKTSAYFNGTGHDFCLTKTNALNILLNYQLACLDEFEIQYIALTGPKAIRDRFDANIDALLADSGEFGCALQQSALIIEDVFKELSNTPGLAERKQRQIDQMRFYEGEVIFRKLPDEVFDQQGNFVTNEELNIEIFEQCASVIRTQFCFKYSQKDLAGNEYQFYYDPTFRRHIAEVARKFLLEHQEFK